MPITYGNVNYRRKYEAFQVVDSSGKNPLREAINTVMEMQSHSVRLLESFENCVDWDTKSKLAMALERSLPDQFNAWIKVCEFVYAKPKSTEQTPEDSVKNADSARETLRWMEEVAARAHGTESTRSHTNGVGNGKPQIQTPPTSATGI